MNEFISSYLIKRPLLQAIADGQLSLGYDLSVVTLVAGALVLILIVGVAYRRTTRALSFGWRALFAGLRATTLLLLAFCLLEPSVLVSEVVPQETYLGVLIDDSKSMSIQDDPKGRTRHQQAVDLLFKREHIVGRLSENFQVRTYRFSDVAQRVSGPEDLEQSGNESSLQAALQYVTAELSALPLAAVVLVSDGADNSNKDPHAVAQQMAAREIPLYTVGVGREKIERDLNIINVSADKSLLEGSIYTVHVTLAQQGYNGEKAQVIIENNGLDIAEKTTTLPEEGAVKRLSFEIIPDQEEILVYEVRLKEKDGETITENNRYPFYIDNRKKEPLDILYVEGQPRNEYKFIRRALQGDPSLRLVSYLQTGPQKFLRQGIKSADELRGGFPQTAEELFQYEAIILGNVSKTFFTDKQLQALRDFVAKRGGGFMTLGSIEESFVDSPLADILPVELVLEKSLPYYLQGGARRGEHPTGTKYTVQLTKEGEYSPLLRLSSSDSENRRLWRAMPPLEGINVSGRAKPGATVLIEHPTLTLQNIPLPVLAIQRYGSGRSMTLNTASTWRWQMLMNADDQSHARLWRQMLRWLATPSQSRVQLTLDQESYDVGESVGVSASLLNRKFEPDNNGILWMTLSDESGQQQELPMTWDIEGDGIYKQTVKPGKQGVYDLSVNVASDAEVGLSAKTPLLVTPSRREFLQAGMDGALLQRLASITHGNFYNTDTAERLVDDITFSPNAYSRQEPHSLWDQPLFWYVLVALVTIEWSMRRYKGLS